MVKELTKQSENTSKLQSIMVDGTMDKKWVVKLYYSDNVHQYYGKNKKRYLCSLATRDANKEVIECESFREACGLLKSNFNVKLTSDERPKYNLLWFEPKTI